MTQPSEDTATTAPSELGLMLDDVVTGRALGDGPHRSMRFLRYMRYRTELRLLLTILLVLLGLTVVLASVSVALFATGQSSVARGLAWALAILAAPGALITTGLLAILLWLRLRVRRIFRTAVLSPGIIVSTDPIEYVSLVDIGTGIGHQHPALKRTRVPWIPIHEIAVGARLPCASIFFGMHNVGRWKTFDSDPLCFITGNRFVLEDAEATIGDSAFRRLEAHVHRHDIPEAPGDIQLLRRQSSPRSDERLARIMDTIRPKHSGRE